VIGESSTKGKFFEGDFDQKKRAGWRAILGQFCGRKGLRPFNQVMNPEETLKEANQTVKGR